MIQVFSQLLSAALGSVGFGLIFNLNRRYLPAAGVGGLLAWLAYLLAANILRSDLAASFLPICWPVSVPLCMPKFLPDTAMHLLRLSSSPLPFPSFPEAPSITA